MLASSIHYSNATQDMLGEKINAAIIKWSSHFKLDERLVRAIIKTESNFQPWAIRLEPHLKRARWYVNAVPDEYRSEGMAFCSMGLMQVMFGIAVADHGYQGTPLELMNPDTAIYYGCKHLAWMKKRFPNGNDYIAAYNQGNGRFIDIDGDGLKDENESYVNQQYVDKVLKNLADLPS